MASLVHQRCFYHAGREAVARCPECRRFFCRECITEHDDRVLCASCLAKLAERTGTRSHKWRGILAAAGGVAAVLVLWMFFYGWGRILVSMPSSFHEGTLWESAFEEQP